MMAMCLDLGHVHSSQWAVTCRGPDVLGRGSLTTPPPPSWGQVGIGRCQTDGDSVGWGGRRGHRAAGLRFMPRTNLGLAGVTSYRERTSILACWRRGGQGVVGGGVPRSGCCPESVDFPVCGTADGVVVWVCVPPSLPPQPPSSSGLWREGVPPRCHEYGRPPQTRCGQ